MELSFYKDKYNKNYISSFPSEWINDHEENKSGPHYCTNCFKYGSIKNFSEVIFLGYCMNCAQFKYKKKRGLGFFGFFDEHEFCEEMVPDYLKTYRNTIIYIYKESMINLNLN